MTIFNAYVASAFSKDDKGGNKAGVIIGRRFTEAQKTEIAGYLRYSETVFVSISTFNDFKLEYFTSKGEIPLCGHATIAAFTVLRHLGLLKKQDCTIETKSGILRVQVDESGLILMEQNRPQFYETLDRKEAEACFDSIVIDHTLPVQIVSTGLKDILVPVTNPVVLGSMAPDFPAITRISRENECIGIHAFSPGKDRGVTAICRNFAPLYGINEESATGTSTGALACYLYKYASKQNQYIFEQGYNLHCVSRIYVNLDSEDDTVTGVWVGGYGYLNHVYRIVF
jgi:PhzF family phenazine biosynthesis protein